LKKKDVPKGKVREYRAFKGEDPTCYRQIKEQDIRG
jgi:hypothetical protein